MLYRSTLRENNPNQEKGIHDFNLSQDIVKAVEYFAKEEPKAVKEFNRKMSKYMLDLESLH